VLGSESFGIEEREICGSIGKHFEGRDGRDEGSVSLLQTAITVLQCLRFPCLGSEKKHDFTCFTSKRNSTNLKQKRTRNKQKKQSETKNNRKIACIRKILM
jgi:hypothetical protein